MTDKSKTRPPMTCEAVTKDLEPYLAAELAPDDESRLARHLTGCSSCAAEAGLAERVAVELAALPAFDAPPELIERIKAAARSEQAPVVVLASRRPRPLVRMTAVAAALLAALAIGWWQMDRSHQPSAAEVAAAEQEARYALALVARIGRRASAEVRQEVFVERVVAPVLRGMGRPFDQGARDGAVDESGASKTGGLKS